MRLQVFHGAQRGAGALGDFARLMAAEIEVNADAATRAVHAAGDGLQRDWRAQITGSGLGQRLARTVRLLKFPKGGTSMRPAGFVYTRAPRIIEAFDKGVTIRSRRGGWLAIPTEAAPRKGTDGKKISPATWPAHRLGPLRFVRLRNGRGILVADNVRASFSRKDARFRGFRRASKRALRTGQGLASAVMFTLVRVAKLRRRLDVHGAAAKWAGRIPAEINRQIPIAERRNPVVRRYL